jgi:hypothetical protein
MLLAGVWYSRDKPTMTTFLKPIIDEINELYVHGNVKYIPTYIIMYIGFTLCDLRS